MKVSTIKVQKKQSNQWYWTLVASNGKVLATSEMYSTRRMATKTANNLADFINEDMAGVEVEVANVVSGKV